jgi:UDP-galactopyranose mutase
MKRKKFIIIGAGPTGLGAGYRLRELGEKDFLILEQNSHVGGLAASFVDEQGFTWDLGGHVFFSHYDYVDRLLERLLGEDFLEHRRQAYIRLAETWVPYPFQNNLRHLPPQLQWECFEGLLNGHARIKPKNFRSWLEFVFGSGIARLFMWPYNFKVWAHPLETMDFRWTGQRVSVIDLPLVLKNFILARDDVHWGPNSRFRFPLYGGTGEIFRRLAHTLQDQIYLGQMVREIDSKRKVIVTHQGLEVEYEHLLSTAPLDLLVNDYLRDSRALWRRAAQKLKHNGIYVVGVGLPETRPDKKSWMYFPEDNAPFYRVTNFHNYSQFNTPQPGEGRALMGEIAFSDFLPRDRNTLTEDTIRGLENTSLLSPGERRGISSLWVRKIDYAYPIPCLQRDQALRLLQPELEARAIYSRGRFGGWKYEVGNMDHSLMQGVEWAERLVLGTGERTYVSG